VNDILEYLKFVHETHFGAPVLKFY